jgi:hypothetical protein
MKERRGGMKAAAQGKERSRKKESVVAFSSCGHPALLQSAPPSYRSALFSTLPL